MTKKCFWLIAILLLVKLSPISAQTQKFDVFIKNAVVFKGDGKDSVRTNIGITAQRISYIGSNVFAAKEVIDAKGRYLAPGFIDPHTHAARLIDDKKDPFLLPWLTQGVTTVFMGSDGGGTFKVEKQQKAFEKTGVGTNYSFFVGFGPIRTEVLGQMNVKPSAEQLAAMKVLVNKGMEEGGIGFSTGLIYLPQMYAKTDEIKALFQETAKYNAVYDTHMRAEGADVLKSVDEVLAIGKNLHLPLHISHIKVSGEANWGVSAQVIDKINAARAQGLNITANQYPFVASMTSLKATVIPDWAQEGGSKKTLERFENTEDLARITTALNKRTPEGYKKIVIMSRNEKLAAYKGKSVYQISQDLNLTPAQAAIAILKIDMGASIVNFSMGEADILAFMKQPWVMTGSDGGGLHPRTYATFSKIIEDYVVKNKVMSMAWAVHRATGLTATTFGLKDRGFIKEGYYADLIIFDPHKVKVNSTFEDPEHLSEGMDYVFVNGVKAVDGGKKTGALAGQIIKNAAVSKP